MPYKLSNVLAVYYTYRLSDESDNLIKGQTVQACLCFIYIYIYLLIVIVMVSDTLLYETYYMDKFS